MFSFDASGLIRLYDNSMYNLLCSIYPEHPWKPWMFVDAVPNGNLTLGNLHERILDGKDCKRICRLG